MVGPFQKVLFRVAFFGWLAALEKIITMDNHQKQYAVVVDCCYLCKRNRESVDHLLLHCEVVCAIKIFYFLFLFLFYFFFSVDLGCLGVMPR